MSDNCTDCGPTVEQIWDTGYADGWSDRPPSVSEYDRARHIAYAKGYLAGLEERIIQEDEGR